MFCCADVACVVLLVLLPQIYIRDHPLSTTYISMVKFNPASDGVSDAKPIATAFKTAPQYSTQPSRVVYGDETNTIRSIASKPKSKCSVSRLIVVQLLILLALLVLAAIIIPIVVIVLDSQSKTSPCATTFSQSFTTGVFPTSQCAAWQTFTNGLTCASYSTMRIYGSNDPTGITVTDPLVATTLAVALRQNTTIIIPSNGVTWRVWPCSNAMEITSTGSACTCTVGYTIRPCWSNNLWGGIQSTSCSGPSQTMSLYFA